MANILATPSRTPSPDWNILIVFAARQQTFYRASSFKRPAFAGASRHPLKAVPATPTLATALLGPFARIGTV